MIGFLRKIFGRDCSAESRPLRVPDDTEIVETLAHARKVHVEAAIELDKANKRQIRDAEIVRQVVKGVLSRAEEAERVRGNG